VEIYGHRGACGYLPENTMESFELAFELGSHAIEFDVVMTRDGVPVIRHDRDLSHTTDIAKHGFLSNKVDELDFENVAKLRAKERYPEGRVESAEHDGRYGIPTLDQVLANPKFNGKHLIIEIKYGRHFEEAGLDAVEAVAQSLERSDVQERDVRITLECFEFGILRRAKERIGSAAKYVFLTAPDMLPEGFTALTDELLDEIAQTFDGLSAPISMVLGQDLVARAKERGLTMLTFTARTETAEGSWQDWFAALAGTGVDGIFCDQPDLMIETVTGLA